MTRKAPSLRIALSIAIVAALALVSAALAAKGGPSPATPTATLVPDCNPCTGGTIVHFTGSGYDGSQISAQVYFKSADGSTTGAAIPVNPDGTISFGWYLSGTRDVQVYQAGKGHKWVLMGETMVYVA